VFRIAEQRKIELHDCRVRVVGGFDDPPPRSSGISYEIEVTGVAPADELEALARDADASSTIPNLLRASTTVVLEKVLVHPELGR